MRLLVATRSLGKQREFATLLAPLGAELVFPDDVGLPEHPDEALLEQGSTFEANAAAKAWWFAHLSGLPALADDSGLEVDALGGAPGVLSKRFGGPDGPDHLVTDRNNLALLRALAAVPEAERTARYRCTLVLARPASVEEWPWPQPEPGKAVIIDGVTNGRILMAPDGEGGFGYDPLFHSDDLGMSFGRAGAAAKHAVSHRGRAVAMLIEALQQSGHAHRH